VSSNQQDERLRIIWSSIFRHKSNRYCWSNNLVQ